MFSQQLNVTIVSYMHTTSEVLVYYSVVNISIVIYTSTKFETNDRRESILIIVLSFSSVSRCLCQHGNTGDNIDTMSVVSDRDRVKPQDTLPLTTDKNMMRIIDNMR